MEIGRLAKMQRSPLEYVERRIENLDLADDHHYRVSLSQQIVIPFHGNETSGEERELLVPLGQFSKDRMPNLRVEGPNGELLPVLSRSDRGVLGATLVTNAWGEEFFRAVPAGGEAIARAAWEIIWQLMARAVAGSKREAEIQLDTLERTLSIWASPGEPPAVQTAALALLSVEGFWDNLYAQAETRLLVGVMRGVPGRNYTVTVQYTERFAYHGYEKGSASGLARKALAWLGLISTPIARSVANLGEVASLWIVQSVPEGVEALRCYWKRKRHKSTPDDPVSVEVTRAVASSHPAKANVSPGQELLLLDVQIAPSTALLATIGLAALLLLVSTYVYQAIPTVTPVSAHGSSDFLVSVETVTLTSVAPDEGDRTLLVGLGSVFAAVPAAIAGALAYRGENFVRHASRGPRALLALLSVQAAFFAVVVSLKNLGDLAEMTAYVVSIYSLFLIGIFSYIQFGPRWRKSVKSRRKSVTREASPITCRKNQFWAAVGWLATWTFLVLVFARCQTVLQQEHFFSGDFPGNIWQAWWSFF